MNKYILFLLTFLLLGASGCTNVSNQLGDFETYVDTDLGISFKITNPDVWNKDEIKRDGNKVMYGNQEEGALEVFNVPAGQDVEGMIFDLIYEQGKNVENCIVNRDYRSDSGMVYTSIRPFGQIEYTLEEQQAIVDADATAGDGPLNGQWKKGEFYQDHLINLCSQYADPAHPGTCKTIGARFLYHEAVPDKFVFLPPEICDEPFYEEGSIKFLETK